MEISAEEMRHAIIELLKMGRKLEEAQRIERNEGGPDQAHSLDRIGHMQLFVVHEFLKEVFPNGRFVGIERITKAAWEKEFKGTSAFRTTMPELNFKATVVAGVEIIAGEELSNKELRAVRTKVGVWGDVSADDVKNWATRDKKKTVLKDVTFGEMVEKAKVQIDQAFREDGGDDIEPVIERTIKFTRWLWKSAE